MNRRELLLSMFDPGGFGLEIGPSYNPLLPKAMGYNVETVDHADADTLRKKYRDDPNTDESRIEDVDYVSDGGSLLDLIGRKERYDFIFASHVIEHVTDIVRFLLDCEALLKPDGALVLAVPDKRYCFDALRPVSTVGQALEAFHEGRKRHRPGTIFDHESLVCTKAGYQVWIEPTLDDVAIPVSPREARAISEAARASAEYVDIHAWQFTPSSFRHFVATLHDAGYIRLRERSFLKDAKGEGIGRHEFYIVLSRAAPASPVALIDLLKDAEREIREIHVSQDENKDFRIGELEGELAAAQKTVAEVQNTVAEAIAIGEVLNRELGAELERHRKTLEIAEARERELVAMEERLAQAIARTERLGDELATERDAVALAVAEAERLEAALAAERNAVAEAIAIGEVLNRDLAAELERHRKTLETVAGLDGELALERNDKAALLNSTSWKVTAPLRWLKTAVASKRTDA